MAIIKLKRARNSLVDVSKLPPEILGDIFRRNVTLEETFGGLERGCYNFLLVCHHWFEVASRAPEVWSSWGNNLQDWSKWCLRRPTGPLDLVLDGERWSEWRTLSNRMRNALLDRGARDTIRRIHLVSEDSKLLDSIISPLVGRKGIRSSSLESVVLVDKCKITSVDVSDFFNSHRFPRLQRLELDHCTISSWDFITSRTSTLTTLSLNLSYPSLSPTTLQLFSILGSNHSLQKLSLLGCAVPDDGGGDGPSSQTQLHHLRELALAGNTQHVFALLHRFDYPKNMDHLGITLHSCIPEDILETAGPYFRDYLQPRGKSRSGLGLYLSSHEKCIKFQVGDVCGIAPPARGPVRMDNFIEITIELDQKPPRNVLEKVTHDLIAHVPQKAIIYFRTFGDPVVVTDASTQLPSLRALHFENISLRAAFPSTHCILFPLVQRVTLGHVTSPTGEWNPLITFLSRRASSANKLDTLETDRPHFNCTKPVKRIRKLVRVFRMTNDYGF